ncbi:MAG: DUF418 domain-containing protein [Gammaproteobacteria bacterium]|nr:DUF418 domain-containing protein [Gammaproteobacteria bacterium]
MRLTSETDGEGDTAELTGGPVSESGRIEALDVARGFAVLGILLMNVWAFALPKEAFEYPVMVKSLGHGVMETWAVTVVLFAGTQRGLFSLLFGAGAMMIQTRLAKRVSDQGIRKIYYRRIFILIVIGLIDGFIFMWPSDILFVYGLCGLLLFPANKLRTGALLLLTAVVFIVPIAKRSGDLQEFQATRQAYEVALTKQASGVILDEADQLALVTWPEELQDARPGLDDERIRQTTEIMARGSFRDVFINQAKGTIVVQTIVNYHFYFLDALGMMLLGMVIFRAGILTGRASTRMLAVMLVLGVAIGLPISIWKASSIIVTDFAPIAQARTWVVYDVGRVGMVIGYLAAVLLFCRAAWGNWLKQLLAPVGRMALTNYLTQSILGALIFYSFGLGLYGKLAGYQLYLTIIPIWILQIIWSRIWLEHFHYGPFEWVWRSLTYMQWQTLHR